jgi:ornithine cyclodeaminase
VRYLTNADVDRLLGPADALGAVRRAFGELASGTGAVHERQRTVVGDAKLSTLGGVLAGDDVLGAKVYSTVAGRFTFLVVLFAGDGRRLAVLESDALTRLRTAAVSLFGVEVLAPPSPRSAVVFGAGVQAEGHVAAFAAAGFARVVLVSRTPRSELAVALSERHDLAVASTVDPAAAADGDVVVTATRSTTPLFAADLLRPGTHVAAVGSSLPTSAELGTDVYARAGLVVAEWKGQARTEAGGLIQAVDAGVLTWEDVPDLADVVGGRHPGRRSATEVTVLQSTGIGLEDVAVAAAAWRRAEVEGVGQLLG